MEFLHLLEQIRTPFGDALMSLITMLGEETLFIAVALVIFWCVNKKQGYYLLFTGFLGIVCIQILKMIFLIPRPWVLDPSFTIVESAREAATGYSFPSGHTQVAACLYGGIALSSKKLWLRIAGVSACLLIAFSRMYLGVHTPLDVLVSLAIGAALVFALYPIVYRCFDQPKKMAVLIGVSLLLALGNLLFVFLHQFPADVSAENLADAQKVASQMLAMILGMCIIYPVERKYVRFEVRGVWWVQALKLVIGVALILGVRVLLKSPCNALLGVNLGSALRYFIIVMIAGLGWPLTFPFWSRLGKKKEA